MRGGEARRQESTVASAENADVDLARLDLTQVGGLGIGVASAELLEHDGSSAKRANAVSGCYSLFAKFLHHARDERPLVSSPLANGLLARNFRRRGTVNQELVAFVALPMHERIIGWSGWQERMRTVIAGRHRCGHEFRAEIRDPEEARDR